MDESFPIKQGQKLSKREIHDLVGGSDQHAMTSCMNGEAFLIFYDPKTSRKNKYDLWEGQQIDGSFWYTGQGLVGDQQMTRSNRGLVKAAEDGRPIHFFRRPENGVKREKGNPYEYVGPVVLGDPPYEVKAAPDTRGNERQVFVFRLVTLGGIPVETSEKMNLEGAVLEAVAWKPLQSEFAQLTDLERNARASVLEENKLQNRFGRYLSLNGLEPERVSIQVGGMKGSLIPDFVVRQWGFVVEAKPTLSREHIRLAIGQVLDYAFLLKRAGTDLRPAILLPGRPQEDLLELVKSLGITVIVEMPSRDFEIVRPTEDDKNA